MEPIHVMLAEDDLFQQLVIKRTLEPLGLEVTTAEAGDRALALVIEKEFDLAIIDFHLPGLTAEEITLQMRSRDIATPVIIITGDDSIDTERKARSVSPVFYFVKPFGIEDLRAVVETILRSRHRLPEATDIANKSLSFPVEHRHAC